MKDIKDDTKGKIYCVLELEESVLSKWLYQQRQSTDSMQSLSITNGVFHRIRTKNFKTCTETQRTLNSQNNTEIEEWSWSNHVPWLQTILQSYSHQSSMVLTKKKTHRSMKQYRKPRNKLTHLWSINLWHRGQEYTMEKRQSLQ